MNDVSVVTVGRDGLNWYAHPDGHHAPTQIPAYAPVGVHYADRLTPRQVEALAWFASGADVWCNFAFPTTGTICALITRGLLLPAPEKVAHKLTASGRAVAALTRGSAFVRHNTLPGHCDCMGKDVNSQ